jgi:bifunctional DNase/RNase
MLNDNFVELKIDSIRVSMGNYQRVVILKDKSGKYLPIWIGNIEADYIASKLNNVELPRPLLPDTVIDILTALHVRIVAALINKFQNDTYYAQLTIRTEGGNLQSFDCTPSSAIALAIRDDAKIFVDKWILDKNKVEIPLQENK